MSHLTGKSTARKTARKIWHGFLNDAKSVERITRNFESWLHGWHHSGRILTTLPLKDELDISAIIKKLNCPVYLPQCLPQGQMTFRLMKLNSLGGIINETGYLNIPGPQSDSKELELPLNKEDLVIVPGFACNPSRVRLGRGGGYFDRYKERFFQSTTMMLLPEALTEIRFEIETHDMAVDIVITEQEVLAKASAPKSVT